MSDPGGSRASLRLRGGRGLLKFGWIGYALTVGIALLAVLGADEPARILLVLAGANPLLAATTLGPGLTLLAIAPEVREELSPRWGTRILVGIVVVATIGFAILVSTLLPGDEGEGLAVLLSVGNAALLVLASLWGWGVEGGDPRIRSYVSTLALLWILGALLLVAGAAFLVDRLGDPASIPYRGLVLLALVPSVGPLWSAGRIVQLILFATDRGVDVSETDTGLSAAQSPDPFRLEGTS